MNALLSVYDKKGLLELATFLKEQGFELISSGGTHRFLQEAGFPVRSVEEVTGAKEMLDGRVKTLHPAIHGGILANRKRADHLETLKERGILPLDLVCVNLYPFEEKLEQGLSMEEQTEFIDIGGPSMLRSAAKNWQSVWVLSDPSQYGAFQTAFQGEASDPEAAATHRQTLARAVFEKTAAYDGLIAQWLTRTLNEEATPMDGGASAVFPDTMTWTLTKKTDLRYGENPHQKGAFYEVQGQEGSMTTFQQLHGKPLGYINYKDLEAAWRIVCDFEECACAAIKHNTPCGVALGASAAKAYERAHACDPVSIFGGIVALNQEVDEATAQIMRQTMLHIIAAPAFSKKALDVLTAKKNLILIQMNQPIGRGNTLISCDGGVLMQEEDQDLVTNWRVVTQVQPSQEDLEELEFAFKVCKYVKSNAIVVSSERAARGIGGGFVNRIDAAEYALAHAKGAAYLASDAFFPFPDVVQEAASHGIRCIIAPGGSTNDQASIDACDAAGMAMVFTGMRHFRH